jgi:hypothetical protein
LCQTVTHHDKRGPANGGATGQSEILLAQVAPAHAFCQAVFVASGHLSYRPALHKRRLCNKAVSRSPMMNVYSRSNFELFSQLKIIEVSYSANSKLLKSANTQLLLNTLYIKRKYLRAAAIFAFP